MRHMAFTRPDAETASCNRTFCAHRGPANLTTPIVSVHDLRLTLSSRAGAVEVLRGLSFDVPGGQALAIVGASGSGKTSLLMVLAGLEKPTAGQVAVAGQNLAGLTPDALTLLRGQTIGIVFQSFHLMPAMTALENVALPLELAGIDNAPETARALLHDVGLEHRLDHYPAELSGGEQQRVAIARALARNPRLILADEPTGNLDAQTGKHIIDLLFGLQRKTGATLILVTHDETLARASERTIRMSDGRIASDTAATPRPVAVATAGALK